MKGAWIGVLGAMALCLVACPSSEPSKPVKTKEPQKPAARKSPPVAEPEKLSELPPLKVDVASFEQGRVQDSQMRNPLGETQFAAHVMTPRFEGLEKGEEELSREAFCLGLKREVSWARCKGQATDVEIPIKVNKGTKGWTVEISASLRTTSWKGFGETLTSKAEISYRPPVDTPAFEVPRLIRAAVEAWLERLHQDRRAYAKASHELFRWSGMRPAPEPSIGSGVPQIQSTVVGEKVWNLTIYPEHVLLQGFDAWGTTRTRAFSTGIPVDRRLRLLHAEDRGKTPTLYMALPGMRRFDPVKGENKLWRKKCLDKDPTCFGTSVVSLKRSGVVALAGLVSDRLPLGAPLPKANEDLYLLVQDKKGALEIVHLVRGGLLTNRWSLKKQSANAGRLFWLDKEEKTLGIELQKHGQEGTEISLLSLAVDKKKGKAKLHEKSRRKDSQKYAHQTAISDGQGGMLVVQSGPEDEALLRLDASGEAVSRWTFGANRDGRVDLDLVGSKAFVRWHPCVEEEERTGKSGKSPCAPENGAMVQVDLTSGAVKPIQKGLWTSKPHASEDGGSFWCVWRPKKEFPEVVELDASGEIKRAQVVPWGCNAIEVLEDKDLLLSARWPGGGYRLAPPASWKDGQK